MIRVLVVEDSITVRDLLVHILTSDPAIQVVGMAADGEQAIEAVELYRPDVITMDIHMPSMDGFEATRRIMETRPTPIVIISGNRDVHEVETAFQAVQAGALTLLARPHGLGHPDYESSARACVQTVKLMSEVKVVKRWPRTREAVGSAAVQAYRACDIPASALVRQVPAGAVRRIVAIGASTGGPLTIQTILAGLARPFSLPIVIVQHMAPGFIQGLSDWLGSTCGLPVHLARPDELVLPGHVYLAPDGKQMGVSRDERIILASKGQSIFAPSVSFLFQSIAESFGSQGVGILLTGMGRDGASELAQMRQAGALTIAQDAETAVINGMPGEAVKLDAARLVLPPSAIAAALNRLNAPDAEKGQVPG